MKSTNDVRIEILEMMEKQFKAVLDQYIKDNDKKFSSLCVVHDSNNAFVFNFHNVIISISQNSKNMFTINVSKMFQNFNLVNIVNIYTDDIKVYQNGILRTDNTLVNLKDLISNLHYDNPLN